MDQGVGWDLATGGRGPGLGLDRLGGHQPGKREDFNFCTELARTSRKENLGTGDRDSNFWDVQFIVKFRCSAATFLVRAWGWGGGVK